MAMTADEVLACADFKRECFVDLGCSDEQARTAIVWELDWHEFEVLRLAGASVELALEILH